MPSDASPSRSRRLRDAATKRRLFEAQRSIPAKDVDLHKVQELITMAQNIMTAPHFITTQIYPAQSWYAADGLPCCDWAAQQCTETLASWPKETPEVWHSRCVEERVLSHLDADTVVAQDAAEMCSQEARQEVEEMTGDLRTCDQVSREDDESVGDPSSEGQQPFEQSRTDSSVDFHAHGESVCSTLRRSETKRATTKMTRFTTNVMKKAQKAMKSMGITKEKAKDEDLNREEKREDSHQMSGPGMSRDNQLLLQAFQDYMKTI
jgi:hypothetical protein